MIDMEKREAVGKYRVIRPIGKGAEGDVYLAQDEDLHRKVAIKQVYKWQHKQCDKEISSVEDAAEEEMIREAGCGKEEKAAGCNTEKIGRDRGILLEADILRQLKHPMLPVIYDLLWEDDIWYMVMEYIQGVTLQEKKKKNGCATEQQVYVWAEQLLDVMCYLHTRKPPVIYRDLKPQNVMVCSEDKLRLIDFGAAHCRNFGVRAMRMAATPGYGAPEQFGRIGKGIYADERSDIYAFGMLLYFVVTGTDPARPPYTLLAIKDHQYFVGDWLEQIIRRCIRDNPAERYQMVQEIRKDMYKCGERFSKRLKRSFIRVVEKRVWLTEME